MRPLRPLEAAYLGLAVAGTVVPLAAFVPWLAAHGLDPALFVQQMFANRIGAFFGWDVIVSAIVILVAVIAGSDRLRGPQRAGIVVGTLLVGVSLSLPLLRFFRERARGHPA
jgi:hypothetical protein